MATPGARESARSWPPMDIRETVCTLFRALFGLNCTAHAARFSTRTCASFTDYRSADVPSWRSHSLTQRQLPPNHDNLNRTVCRSLSLTGLLVTGVLIRPLVLGYKFI